MCINKKSSALLKEPIFNQISACEFSTADKKCNEQQSNKNKDCDLLQHVQYWQPPFTEFYVIFSLRLL